MFDANEYLQHYRADNPLSVFSIPMAKPVHCQSGLNFSMQASPAHYSAPRAPEGPYTHVEIGFPSEDVPEFAPYRENESSPVYPYVPVEVVERVVEANGGLDPKWYARLRGAEASDG